MKNQEEWEACPPGEISRMVSQERATHRSHWMKSLAIVGCLVITSCAAIVYLQSAGTGPPGGIACDAVQKLFVSYQEHTLSARTERQVKAHLEGCPHCRKKYEEMSSQVSDHEFSALSATALAGAFR